MSALDRAESLRIFVGLTTMLLNQASCALRLVLFRATTLSARAPPSLSPPSPSQIRRECNVPDLHALHIAEIKEVETRSGDGEARVRVTRHVLSFFH